MTRKKEEFIPLEEGKVKMYVCGPTVYNFIHLGNARPFTVFDILNFDELNNGHKIKVRWGKDAEFFGSLTINIKK